MHRALIDPEAVQGMVIAIRDPQTLHHLRDVLRVRVGERLECFDGAGRTYTGPIIRATAEELAVAIEAQSQGGRARVQLTLAQALIRPERFEWVLEKATELGAARIIPILSARCAVRPLRIGSAREARWRRIVKAAATQCGRPTLPHLEAVTRFKELLPALEGQDAFLFTLAQSARPFRELIEISGDRVAILVGPEGDFSPEEVADAAGRGIRLARLGGSTLRSETAAVATMAIVQHALGTL